MLNVTDQELKDLSLTTLQLPLVIDDPVDGTGLVQSKEFIVAEKARLQTLDTQNKIFTDHWIEVLTKYYSELEALDRTVKTLYSEATVILGGQNKLPHYDDATWYNLVPMKSDELVGNPTSVGSNPDEDELVATAESTRSDLVNGFGGAVDDVLDAVHGIGSNTFESSGTFSVGSRVIIDDGTNSFLATVTDDINAPIYDISSISTDKAFGIGDRVRDFHAGFTNSERGHQSTNYANDVMLHFEGVLDSTVASWEANLNIQKTALDNNNDLLPANQVLNTTALSNINSVLPDIATWEGTVVADVDGRYTDTSMPLIAVHLTARPAEIGLRVTDITTNLGPLVQAGDGSVTGVGVYASLYEFVNIRIGKAGGTLYGFYNMDLSVSFYDTKIATAQGQLAQYNNTFAIASIISDTVIGQIEFEVDSVAEFSAGQTVKIMDNDSVVFTRTIDTIITTTIKLDSGITAALTIGSVARIVRQK